MLDSKLRHVVAVARAGSFTAAAQAAGVSQSSVTKSVADVERQIGYAILHRTSRGAILTDRGREFVDRAARLLEDTRELLLRPDEQTGELNSIVHVGVAPASLEWCLVPPIREMIQRYPHLRFDVVSSNFGNVVQQLRQGTIDVAFGFDAAFAEWSDLRRSPAGPLQSKFFVRRCHPLLEKADIALSDLSAYKIISPSSSLPLKDINRHIYEISGVDWERHVHQVDYFPIAKMIVANSDAISLIATSQVAKASFVRDFVAFDVPHPYPAALISCATWSPWETKPIVRRLINAIARSMGTV